MKYTLKHRFELATGGNAYAQAFRLIYRFGVSLVHGLSKGLPRTTVWSSEEKRRGREESHNTLSRKRIDTVLFWVTGYHDADLPIFTDDGSEPKHDKMSCSGLVEKHKVYLRDEKVWSRSTESALWNRKPKKLKTESRWETEEKEKRKRHSTHDRHRPTHFRTSHRW